jgi:small GTP-binding protein
MIVLGRVVLIGETQVGKTSLVQYFLQGKTTDDESETVGAIFHNHEVTIDDRRVVLQIWDTAGQERYRSLGPIYYRKSKAAVAVFDLTRPDTLIALENWISKFRENAESPFVVVVGNKADLESDIQLQLEATNEWAAARDAECIWTSAVTGLGVDEVFNAVCQHLLNEDIHTEDRSEINPVAATDSSCC